jgi:hypothetical protein
MSTLSGSEVAFCIIGGVGLLFLALALFFGEVFEFGDDVLDLDLDGDVEAGDGIEAAPSWLSMKLLAASTVGFGSAGLIASQLGASVGLAWVIAGAGFFLVGAGTFFWVLKPLAKQQSTSLINRNSFVGRTGTIELAIPENDFGTVTFVDANSAYVTQPARSHNGEPIASRTPIIIVDVTPDVVIVTPDTLTMEEHHHA